MTRTLLLIGVAALAGCASSGPTQHQEANRRAIAEARPVGEPISCVNLARIDHTRVRDDQTIDFYLHNGQVYRNTLPSSCPSLGFEERFSYRVSTGQLCSVDVIQVLQAGGGVPGATCGLGKFQRIETSAR
jgi:hypothetical protein